MRIVTPLSSKHILLFSLTLNNLSLKKLSYQQGEFDIETKMSETGHVTCMESVMTTTWCQAEDKFSDFFCCYGEGRGSNKIQRR